MQAWLRQPLDLSVPMSQGTGSGVQLLLGEGIPGCGGHVSCHTGRTPMLSHRQSWESVTHNCRYRLGWQGKQTFTMLLSPDFLGLFRCGLVGATCKGDLHLTTWAESQARQGTHGGKAHPKVLKRFKAVLPGRRAVPSIICCLDRWWAEMDS